MNIYAFGQKIELPCTAIDNTVYGANDLTVLRFWDANMARDFVNMLNLAYPVEATEARQYACQFLNACQAEFVAPPDQVRILLDLIIERGGASLLTYLQKLTLAISDAGKEEAAT